jgi:hypothetical protein
MPHRFMTVVIACTGGCALLFAGASQAAPRSCMQKAPLVSVDNNFAWSSPGSWGTPGQTLTYAIDVLNYDVGCGSSSFVVGVSAPTGFSVSLPTSAITLKSSSSAYLSAQITSPANAADGDHPLTFTVQRTGSTTPGSAFTSYYKVYSTDTTAPTLFFLSPSDGQTISGRSYNLSASASDDHAVKEIELYLDGVHLATQLCDDVSYTCVLTNAWSLRGVRGQHTATFLSYDWIGNMSAATATFTVG